MSDEEEGTTGVGFNANRHLNNCLNPIAALNSENTGQSFDSSQYLLSVGSIDDGGGGDDILRLRSGLNYFFMDPLKKWQRKNTTPWKLFIQIVKIVIVTMQLILFGSNMAEFISYKDEMQTTFKQLFLKDWDPSADAIAYPGPYVPYAVYTKPDFMQAMNHAIRIYSNISDLSVGPFGYQSDKSKTVPPIDICITNYIQAEFDPTTFKFNYSLDTSTTCKRIQDYAEAGSDLWQDFDYEQYFKESINFPSLIRANITFLIRTMLFEGATSGRGGVVCFNVDAEVYFDNGHRDGQIVIGLESVPQRADCKGQIKEIRADVAIRLLLNVAVLTLNLMSALLCLRSLYRAYRLCCLTEKVLDRYGRSLESSDRFEFLDFWLVMILVNDVLIMSATVIILAYDKRILETDYYTICSLMLGMGNLLAWSGLLRYLSFFRRYNILILTLRKSFVHVTRFMLCTLLIYSGFCFCGWIVFGPYHFKFRHLSTTTECLFALINGDDMFETFALLREDLNSVWWFSRVYLYSFISLFIYVVLSLFIALIMDAYEVIKEYSTKGFPKSRLQSFYLDGDINKLAPGGRHL